MGLDVRRSEDNPEPGDRLGMIAKRLLRAFEADPDVRGGERLMVMIAPLQYGERGSVATCGYDDEAQAKTDLTIQLKALYEASGQEIEIVVTDA